MIGVLFGGAASVASMDGLRSWFIFFGLSPLINGVSDYLSCGVTRWLLASGARRGEWRTIAIGAADLIAALLLFTALGRSLIVVLMLMNAVAPASIVDRRSAGHAQRYR